jgi:DNA gyrase subunit A
MCGLRHVQFDLAARDEYLSAVNARRRLAGSDYSDRPEDQARDQALAAGLDEPLFCEMAATEEFLLTVSEDGYGKRTSSYDYRISGRAGHGIAAMDLERADGAATVVAAFPLHETDQIVMVTDGGQLIRLPISDISIMSRRTRGVRLFATAEGERVVSVSRIRDVEEDDIVGDDEAGGEDEIGLNGDASPPNA